MAVGKEDKEVENADADAEAKANDGEEVDETHDEGTTVVLTSVGREDDTGDVVGDAVVNDKCANGCDAMR